MVFIFTPNELGTHLLMHIVWLCENTLIKSNGLFKTGKRSIQYYSINIIIIYSFEIVFFHIFIFFLFISFILSEYYYMPLSRLIIAFSLSPSLSIFLSIDSMDHFFKFMIFMHVLHLYLTQHEQTSTSPLSFYYQI